MVVIIDGTSGHIITELPLRCRMSVSVHDMTTTMTKIGLQPNIIGKIVPCFALHYEGYVLQDKCR